MKTRQELALEIASRTGRCGSLKTNGYGSFICMKVEGHSEHLVVDESHRGLSNNRGCVFESIERVIPFDESERAWRPSDAR